jgi:alpha-L-fucosidase
VWQAGASGEFANIAYALATQRIAFAQPRTARFLRLRFDAPAVAGATRVAVAGIGAFTTPQGAPQPR